MKNKRQLIIMLVCIITFLIYLLSLFFHFPIPTDQMKGGGTTEFLNTGDKIVQEYYFDERDVRSIIFREATYGYKVKHLDMTVTLYNDKNIKIASKNYNFYNMHDGLFLELPIKYIDMHGIYKLEFKINELSDGDIFVLYKTDDVGSVTSYKCNDNVFDGNIAFTISGYKESYFWTNIILMVFCIELAIFFASYGYIQIKTKKVRIMSFGLYLLFSFTLTLSLFYINVHEAIDILNDFGHFLLGISAFYLIWYFCNYLKNKNKLIERIFLLLIIPLGLMSTVYLMPCETFDIHAHYASSYHPLLDKKHKDKLYVPKVVSEKGYYRVKSYGEYYNLIKEKYNYNDLDYIKEQEDATEYHFLEYIPTTAGLFVGKLFNVSPFLGMYLAKLINLIFFTIIGYFIIKMIPVGKILMLTFMMGPLFIQQATSINADGIINLLSLFFISYLLKIKFDKKYVLRNIDIIVLAFSLLLISIQKINYIVLGLMVFILLKKLKMMKKKQWIVAIISSVLVIIFCLMWYFKGGSEVVTTFDGAISNVTYSSRDIKQLFYALILSLKNLCSPWIADSFGRALGWNHINITPIAYILYIVALTISLFVKNEKKCEYDKFDKFLTIFVYFFGAVLIIYGLYSTWTYIGIMQVNGVQGRYFIPLNILVLLMFKICNKKGTLNDNVMNIIAILLIITNIYSMIGVLQFYS